MKALLEFSSAFLFFFRFHSVLLISQCFSIIMSFVIAINIVLSLSLFLSLDFFFFTTCLGKSKAIVWQIQCSSEVSFRTPIELSQFYHQCQFQATDLYDICSHKPMYCCLNWSLYSQVQRWQLRFGLKSGLAGGQQSCRLLSSRRLATSHSSH